MKVGDGAGLGSRPRLATLTARARGSGPALARIGVQGAFLLIIPRCASGHVVEAAFLAISISSFINPVAALGSQFHAIRAADTSREVLRDAVPTFLCGIGISALASVAAGALYSGHVPMIASALALYVVANYLRSFVDAYAQGIGRYASVQWAYVVFWCVKIAGITFVPGLLGVHHVNFGYITALEIVCSSPWTFVAMVLTRRGLPGANWRPQFVAELGTTFAVIVRTAWMELDKLLLPFFVGSQAYIDYTIANRASLVGITMVAAQLGTLTPTFVRAPRGEFAALRRTALKVEPLALAGTAAAGLVVLGATNHLDRDVIVVSGLSIPLVSTYLRGHIFADYVFYHRGPWARSISNLVGLGTVLCAILVTASGASVYVVTIGQAAGCVFAGACSRIQIGR